MQPSECEIIILKPTRVFLTFLASQLPHVNMPALKLLQTDCTAYLIDKQKDDEATLNEIERHFSTMFRHEICRWLGEDARNEIMGSFLDFLCCFKFEMHSHILLLENNLAQAKQLLSIKPRSVLLKWIRSAVEDDTDLVSVLDKISLSNLAENATVVAKNFPDLSEIKPFLYANYQPIFDLEMMRMCDNKSQWPVIKSYEQFNQYFSVNIHTQLIDLR